MKSKTWTEFGPFGCVTVYSRQVFYDEYNEPFEPLFEETQVVAMTKEEWDSPYRYELKTLYGQIDRRQ